MSFKERYLRGDCSIDMINDYVEMWHGEGEIKKTLSEFLGLSQEEYVCWMISSDEELARMLSRSLPHRDLPYCARHIGWKELKEQLEQAVQTLLSPDYTRIKAETAAVTPKLIGKTCSFRGKDGRIQQVEDKIFFFPKRYRRYGYPLDDMDLLILAWSLGIATEVSA